MYTTDFVKKVAFRYTNFFKPTYPYNLEPIQLAALVIEIDRLKDVTGSIVEIGVARGMTTRFLCEHFTASKYPNPSFFAIDTFNSFLDRDIEYEVKERGKKKGILNGNFGYNDFEIWKRNFCEFPFLKPIQSDCAAFDYTKIAPIKLAFLDVDLYLPTKLALPRIYEQLCIGGVILVDDVSDNSMYDGAYQSYCEFCQELGIPTSFIGGKCGVIRKE